MVSNKLVRLRLCLISHFLILFCTQSTIFYKYVPTYFSFNQVEHCNETMSDRQHKFRIQKRKTRQEHNNNRRKENASSSTGKEPSGHICTARV